MSSTNLVDRRVNPRALSDLTPPGRDRYIDFLRALAIAAVVVGHWLVVVPSYDDGRFGGINALATVPLMRYLTWAFQVMPLFFIVGGIANARSWRSATARGDGYGAWMGTRLRRLTVPSLWFIGVWTALAVALRGVGVDADLVTTIASVVVIPVWFLAVYVLVAAAAPVMLAVHDRWGALALPVLLSAVALVDAVRFQGVPGWIAYTNFLWVFLFAQQLGFLWLDGRLPTRRSGHVLFALGGFVAMVLLCTVGPYSMSLVGVPGEAVQNNAPPTAMLVFAGVMQVGFALLARVAVEGILARPRVWSVVVGCNAHAMTILLWHFTALVVGALVLLPLEVVPMLADGSLGWWAERIGAVVVLTAPLALLLWIFGPIERRSLLAPTPTPRPGFSGRGSATSPSVLSVETVRIVSRLTVVRVLAATVSLAVGFALVATGGLSTADAPMGVPVRPVLFLVAGMALAQRVVLAETASDGSRRSRGAVAASATSASTKQ